MIDGMQNYLTVTFGSSTVTADVFEPIVPVAKRRPVPTDTDDKRPNNDAQDFRYHCYFPP